MSNSTLKNLKFMHRIKSISDKAFIFLRDFNIILSKSNITDAILVIRLDAIGDFILWLDAAQYLRKIYPDRKIVLLGNEIWTNLAQKFSYWDEVWELNRYKFCENMSYRLRLLKKIRRAGFDTVVQPTYSRELLYGDAIIRVSGARERIGSVGDYSNTTRVEKKMGNFFYTQLITNNPKNIMELKRNADFFNKLGYRYKSNLPDLMPAVKGINNPVANISSYFVLFPGASWTGRQWPIENFSELATIVFHKTGMPAVICGGVNEKKLGEALIAKIEIPVINMVGKTNLPELAAIIKDARFLLGNETSAVHVASAVSTPAFCLLGGGHYKRFMPYDIEATNNDRPFPVAIVHKMECFNCNWRCQYLVDDGYPVPCIKKITVKKVFCALDPIIMGKSNIIHG